MGKRKIIMGCSIVAIFAIIIAFVILYINNHNKVLVKDQIDYTKAQMATILDYLNKTKIGTEGVLNISAKYKGAHGEHYPKESVYNFETEYDNGQYKIYIGNSDGYIEKTYNNSLYKLYRDTKDQDVEDLLATCEFEVNTKGFIKEVVSTELKCLNYDIIFEDKSFVIKQDDNKINVDITDSGYSLNINNELRMTAFLEDDGENKYSIVIGEDVFYVETLDNKLTLNASSAAAIYNAMEFSVTYEEVDVEKNKKIEEIEVPIIRYFNEYDFTYWRD